MSTVLGEQGQASSSGLHVLADGIKLLLPSRDDHRDPAWREQLLQRAQDAPGQLDSQDVLSLCLGYLHEEEQAARLCAGRLLDTYADLGRVVSASRASLQATLAGDGFTAGAIKAIQALMLTVLRGPLVHGPVIGSWSMLHDYLRISMGYERFECVRVLHLDGQNRLIKDELHDHGAATLAIVRPLEIVRRAIQLGTKAIILVHSHPSGDVLPSPDDIEMTKHFREMLQHHFIVLQDHVIVGRSRCLSLRQMQAW